MELLGQISTIELLGVHWFNVMIVWYDIRL